MAPAQNNQEGEASCRDLPLSAAGPGSSLLALYHIVVGTRTQTPTTAPSGAESSSSSPQSNEMPNKNGSAKRKAAKERARRRPEPSPEPPKPPRIKPTTSNKTPAPFPFPLIDAPEAPSPKEAIPNWYNPPKLPAPTHIMDLPIEQCHWDPVDDCALDRDLTESQRGLIQGAFRLLSPAGKAEVKKHVTEMTTKIVGPTAVWYCEMHGRTLTILDKQGNEIANTNNRATCYPDRSLKQFVVAMHKIFVDETQHGVKLVAEVQAGGDRRAHLEEMTGKMARLLASFEAGKGKGKGEGEGEREVVKEGESLI